MPSDHPHGVQEGQMVRVTADLAAGLIDQLAQREVDQEQAIDLLLHQVGPAAAQHQPGKATFNSAKTPSLSQRS